MANYNIIKEMCKEKNISLQQLAKEIGITEAGLHQIFKNKTTRVKTLESIANVLRVPINVFFHPEEYYEGKSFSMAEDDWYQFLIVFDDFWTVCTHISQSPDSPLVTILGAETFNCTEYEHIHGLGALVGQKTYFRPPGKYCEFEVNKSSIVLIQKLHKVGL